MTNETCDRLRLAPALALFDDDAALVDDSDAKGVERDVDTDKELHDAALPPVVVYFYDTDRKAERPAAHLIGFKGVLQADGYAGFEKLDGGDVTLAACWVHARRRFLELHAANKSAVAGEALRRISEFYRSSSHAGPTARRQAGSARHRVCALVEAFHAWLKVQLGHVSGGAGWRRLSATR